jgi:hypothetical protein
MLRPAVRESYSRHAYVLRGVGGRYGPVFVERRGLPGAGESATAEPPSSGGRFRRRDPVAEHDPAE